MLNKYYNNSQKHVEKCSESFEDFRNISFIEHSRFIFDISSSWVCMPWSGFSLFHNVKISEDGGLRTALNKSNMEKTITY